MNRAGGAVVRFCRMTRTKWGLRAPTPRGTFLYGQKGTKKPPGRAPGPPGIALRAILHILIICPLLWLGRFYRWCQPFVCRTSASTHGSYRGALLWHIGAV